MGIHQQPTTPKSELYRELSSLSLIMIFIMVTFIGFFLLLYYGRLVWLSIESVDWPGTQGVITKSEIGESHDDGTLYYPIIRYRYSIGGKMFESNNTVLARRNSTERRSEVEEYTKKYSTGKTITIFYRPESLEIACLEPGVIHSENYILISVGFLFAIILTVRANEN